MNSINPGISGHSNGAAQLAVLDAPRASRGPHGLRPVERVHETVFRTRDAELVLRFRSRSDKALPPPFHGPEARPAPTQRPARAPISPGPSAADLTQALAQDMGLIGRPFSPGDWVGPRGRRPVDAYQAAIDRERFMLFTEGLVRAAA